MPLPTGHVVGGSIAFVKLVVVVDQMPLLTQQFGGGSSAFVKVVCWWLWWFKCFCQIGLLMAGGGSNAFVTWTC